MHRRSLVLGALLLVSLPASASAVAQWNREVNASDIQVQPNAVVVRFRVGAVDSPASLNLGTRVTVNINGVVTHVRDYPFTYAGSAGGNTCGGDCTNDCGAGYDCTPFTQGSICGACGSFFSGAYQQFMKPADVIVVTLSPLPGAVAETFAADDQAMTTGTPVPATSRPFLAVLAVLLLGSFAIGVRRRGVHARA